MHACCFKAPGVPHIRLGANPPRQEDAHPPLPACLPPLPHLQDGQTPAEELESLVHRILQRAAAAGQQRPAIIVINTAQSVVFHDVGSWACIKNTTLWVVRCGVVWRVLQPLRLRWGCRREGCVAAVHHHAHGMAHLDPASALRLRYVWCG